MLRPRHRLRWAAGTVAVAVAAVIAVQPVSPASAAVSSIPYMSLYYASERTKAWAYANNGSPGPVKIHGEAVKSMIASQPAGIWYYDWNLHGPDKIYAIVKEEVNRAIKQGKSPIFVPYLLPNRDCGNLSSGGAPSSSDWRAWIAWFTVAIRDAMDANRPDHRVPVHVMLEPDAVALQSGDAGCVDSDGRPVTFDVAQRNRDLQWAVDVLTQLVCIDRTRSDCEWQDSFVQVFLDAGHSAWYGNSDGDVARIADRLTAAGVTRAAGFYTNASNYQPTAKEVVYGDKLRLRLQGPQAPNQKIHVIDTSRNGAVIPSGRQSDTGWPDWCDPTGARLGAPPTQSTGSPTRKTMWIKPPGETDGCFGGSSTVGTGGRDGRGVPANGFKAGSFDYRLACRLIMGSTTCPNVDVGARPAAPTGLRFGFLANDRVTLEWTPSYGACAYQIGYRVNGASTDYIFALMMVGTGDTTPNPRPPSSVYLIGSVIKHGAKVEYAVRARNCGITANYSPYSATVTTRDYP